MDYENKLLCGDALTILQQIPDCSINCCITSPPYYGLRDYGIDQQIGLEEYPQEYVAKLVDIFHEVKRVLRDNGTLWLNLGDCYSHSGKGAATHLKSIVNTKQATNKGMIGKARVKNVTFDVPRKNLLGIPWRVAFSLQSDGWYLRQDIIWAKPNPMPESVTDRCTKSHEYIFLLSKFPKYYFDNDAIQENATYKNDRRKGYGRLHYRGKYKDCEQNFLVIRGKRNKRDVWNVPLKPFKGSHFAVFPEKLIIPCILAGCPDQGIVLDPFVGSGTTALTAHKLGRRYIGIDLNPDYVKMAQKRLDKDSTLMDFAGA